MSEVDTLQKFGSTFQTKCIVALLTDRPFLEQAHDIIVPSYFESEANKWIVERSLWYFNTYRSLPTMEVFKKEVDKVPADNVLRVAIVEALKPIFGHLKNPPDDLKYIKDEFLTFCKNQSLKAAVLKSADLLQTGRYDEIKSIIDKAVHAGAERNLGHVYVEDVETRTNKVTRNVVAMPWQCFNEITDGGLGAGELGCIIAPSGIGKSWFLAKIGAHAVRQGKTVAHYTLELSETYLGLRYDSIYTGIAPNEVYNNVPRVQEIVDSLPGKLYIKYFPARAITVNAINAHIQRMATLGNMPDIVIIDYADLMRSTSKADARHEELGYIYEEIRGMLGEYGIPGWTASQSQRSALNDDVIDSDKIAGAYSKVMACDFIFSATRKLQDKMTKSAKAFVVKNRFGPDGLVFPAAMDLEHGVVEIFDENSPEGIAARKKLQSGEGVLKAMLQKKLIDFKKEPTPDPE